MFPAGGLEPCLLCAGGFNLYLHLTQGFHLRNTKAWYPRLADLYSHFQDFHFYFFIFKCTKYDGMLLCLQRFSD